MKPCGPSRLRFVLLPVFVLAVLALLTFVVRGLWNGVLVDVASVKPVSYWQALGLLVLAKILFGGFPGRHHRCGPPWRSKWDECASMTPEQRAAARDEMRQRFGRWGGRCWSEKDAPTEGGDKKSMGGSA